MGQKLPRNNCPLCGTNIVDRAGQARLAEHISECPGRAEAKKALERKARVNRKLERRADRAAKQALDRIDRMEELL